MADAITDGFKVNEEKLLHRHRKEKKELQARIQSLKHGIPKGDKKKKKEVTIEISKIESDVAKKHQQELKELQENTASTPDCQTDEPEEYGLIAEDIANNLHIGESDEEKPIRLSKAQKRRNKKATKEKEREQRIEEEEKNNVYSDRYIEDSKLKAILSQQALCVKEIPSDGHCLYNAVIHQLSRIGTKIDVTCLRRQVAEYMRSHVDDFLCFLSKPDTGDPYTTEEYEQYCDEIATTAAWGGQHEISAMVQLLKIPIQVIQADGPILTIGEQLNTEPLILTYHRHAFGLGEHYNSVVPIKKPKDSKSQHL